MICVNETQPKSTKNILCCGQQKSYTSSSSLHPLHPTPSTPSNSILKQEETFSPFLQLYSSFDSSSIHHFILHIFDSSNLVLNDSQCEYKSQVNDSHCEYKSQVNDSHCEYKSQVNDSHCEYKSQVSVWIKHTFCLSRHVKSTFSCQTHFLQPLVSYLFSLSLISLSFSLSFLLKVSSD